MDIRRFLIPSRAFAPERSLTVLLPPSYARSRKRYPTLYLHDGSDDWLVRGRLVRVIEQTLEAALSPEFIVVMPEPVARTREYKLSSAHLAFMTEEVVPWVDAHLRARAKPSERAVHGVSLGGLSAIWLGLARPDLFAGAGGQGGAYWYWKRRVIRQVRRTPEVRTRFFVSCGRQDGNLSDNRALVEALREKRACCLYEEVPGRHSWACWRRSVPRALAYYFGDGRDS